jgi:hypothetical protein
LQEIKNSFPVFVGHYMMQAQSIVSEPSLNGFDCIKANEQARYRPEPYDSNETGENLPYRGQRRLTVGRPVQGVWPHETYYFLLGHYLCEDNKIMSRRYPV